MTPTSSPRSSEWPTPFFRDAGVVTLQEVHGSCDDTHAIAQRVDATHAAFCSAGVPESVAGTIVFIKHKWLGKATVRESNLIAGRVLGVQITTATTRLAILGVHNYGMGSGDIVKVKRWIQDATTTHFGAVLFATVVWNFDESDDGVITTTGRGDTTSHRARREQARRAGTLRALTSLPHGLPTRAARTTTPSGTTITQSSLDRVYTSLPPTTLAFTKVMCRVAPLHTVLRPSQDTPPSEHTTVRTTLTSQTRPKLAHGPIPLWATRHPRYAADLRRRLAAISLAALTAADTFRRCHSLRRRGQTKRLPLPDASEPQRTRTARAASRQRGPSRRRHAK